MLELGAGTGKLTRLLVATFDALGLTDAAQSRLDTLRRLDPALVCLAHEGTKRYQERFDLIHRREADGVLPRLPDSAAHLDLHHGAVHVTDHGQPPAILIVDTAEGHFTFDSVYPALGSDTHTELAERIGVAISADTGCITVDSHQRTSAPGIYAAGDVVLGLDQISHAMGEGGVASTTIRNDLAKQRPRLREPAEEGVLRK